jgi:hypothetical protein
MEHDTMTCEICDGPGTFLGNMGNHAVYRCRNCGMMFDVEGVEGDLDNDDVQDWEDDLSDVEADAMTLASAGMGTDEDYGCYDDGDFGSLDDF